MDSSAGSLPASDGDDAILAPMSYRYRFLTTWLLETSRASAWEVLLDPLSWSQWWRSVQRVTKLTAGDGRRVGSRYRIAWRSRIPYELEFDFTVRKLDEPCCMEGDATGDLAGAGILLGRIHRQHGMNHRNAPDHQEQAHGDEGENGENEAHEREQADQQIEDRLEDLPIDQQRQRGQEDRDEVDHTGTPELPLCSSRG